MHSRRVVVAVVFLLTMSAAALAGPFTSVIAYGDSLSDNGNLYQVAGRPPSPPYFNGRFSNRPVAVEDLAAALGAPLFDFAWGGATTGVGSYADNGSDNRVWDRKSSRHDNAVQFDTRPLSRRWPRRLCSWSGVALTIFWRPRRPMPETRSKPQTAASRTCWPSSLHYRASERSTFWFREFLTSGSLQTFVETGLGCARKFANGLFQWPAASWAASRRHLFRYGRPSA